MDDARPLFADITSPPPPWLGSALPNSVSTHRDDYFAQLVDLVQRQRICAVVLGEVDAGKQELAQLPDPARVLHFGAGYDAARILERADLAAPQHAVDRGAEGEGTGGQVLGWDKNIAVDGKFLAIADGDVDCGCWG